VGSEDSFVKTALTALECFGSLAVGAQAIAHRIQQLRLEREFGLGGLDESTKCSPVRASGRSDVEFGKQR
jgi:hypothetical protein